MKPVVFTKGSAKEIVCRIAEEHKNKKCLCVYVAGGTIQNRALTKGLTDVVNANIVYIDFKDYGKDTELALVSDRDATLIVVGLSEMIRPSNRCDLRFEYMYNFANVGRKYVIDHAPFLQEKWRTWYPYGVIDPEIMRYPHSYAIEGAYRKFQDEIVDEDPLELKKMIGMIAPYTSIDYRCYFDNIITYDIHEPTSEQVNEYFTLKDYLFDKYSTPFPIIKELSKYCQGIYSDRTIFRDLRKLYTIEGNAVIKMVNLKVDWYLRSEIDRVIRETNFLTEGLYDLSRKKRP